MNSAQANYLDPSMCGKEEFWVLLWYTDTRKNTASGKRSGEAANHRAQFANTNLGFYQTQSTSLIW